MKSTFENVKETVRESTLLSLAREFFENVPAPSKTYHNILKKITITGKYFQYPGKNFGKKHCQLDLKSAHYKISLIKKSHFVPVKISLASTRETFTSTREKIWKSARENFLLPVKIFKKVPVKNSFYP